MLIRNPMRVLFAVIFISVAPVSQVAWAQSAAPVIYSVTLREDIHRYEVVYPEFHFQDSSGTVKFIHREVIATNYPKPLHVKDGVISISPDQQKKGATFAGVWRCGPESYYATLHAFMLNTAGLKSNEVEYTIHCNGG